MRNAFLNWIVLVLGVIGFVYLIVIQNEDFVSQIFGVGVVSLAVFYFVRFEQEGVKLITQRVASIISFNSPTQPIPERHAQKIIYCVIIIIIATISAILLFYHLGERDFWEDEHPVIAAAAGYYHAGDFVKWDWIKKDASCKTDPDDCRYDRAWPHSWLIAQSYKLFGISEWSSRLVSALFMLAATLGVYFLAKFFTANKNVALLAMFSVALHPNLVIIGRYTRMYAFLVPVFLLLVYLIFKAISPKIHYGYAIGAAITLGVGYLIHINILVILPAAFLFIVYQAIATRQKEHIVLSLLGIIGLTAIYNMAVFTPWLDKIAGFLSFFGRNNTVYLEYIAGFPFPAKFGLAVALLGLASSMMFLKNNELKHKLIYLYCITLFTLFFFIYIGDRYASFVYTAHVAVIFIIIAINSYMFFVDRIKVRALRIICLLILLLNPAYIFYENRARVYEGEGFGKISTAYASIIKNIKPGEPIFGQYLRGYYLQDISPQTPIISMASKQSYSYQAFQEDLARYESGWITWETRKSSHLQPAIQSYIKTNFRKIHGEGIDDTRTEVYYFER